MFLGRNIQVFGRGLAVVTLNEVNAIRYTYIGHWTVYIGRLLDHLVTVLVV